MADYSDKYFHITPVEWGILGISCFPITRCFSASHQFPAASRHTPSCPASARYVVAKSIFPSEIKTNNHKVPILTSLVFVASQAERTFCFHIWLCCKTNVSPETNDSSEADDVIYPQEQKQAKQQLCESWQKQLLQPVLFLLLQRRKSKEPAIRMGSELPPTSHKERG